MSAEKEFSKISLWVGHFPKSVTDEEFDELLKEKSISFEKARLRKRQGRARGYGVVMFKSEKARAAAEKALEGATLRDKEVHIKPATKDSEDPDTWEEDAPRERKPVVKREPKVKSEKAAKSEKAPASPKKPAEPANFVITVKTDTKAIPFLVNRRDTVERLFNQVSALVGKTNFVFSQSEQVLGSGLLLSSLPTKEILVKTNPFA
eukprot:TRINITY_DN3110_c1_g1_i1.p2 TRINITY_DN3110_c1_g1~~TRINITY_DN3110_c1_g1_i1.p2  ORF type:complete len:213 (-),score=46.41 TRINITY_DN3110_c1_g1_i1:158-775(-)